MSRYKRDPFKAQLAKRFPKHDNKIITITIDEEGDVLFLKTDANDIFLDQGTVVTKRASHVEPAPLYERLAFHLLRAVFGDKGKVSDWTRTWRTLWRVNTKPVGGPILTWGHIYPAALNCSTLGRQTYCFGRRQDAIDAEIEFLNKFFLEGR